MWKKLLSHIPPPHFSAATRPCLPGGLLAWPRQPFSAGAAVSGSVRSTARAAVAGLCVRDTAEPQTDTFSKGSAEWPSRTSRRERRGSAARRAGEPPQRSEACSGRCPKPPRAWCRPRPSPSWVGHSESGPSGWGGLHSGAQMLVRTCARPKPRSPRPSVGPQTPREEGLRGDAVTCKATCQPGRGGRRASGFVRSRRSGAVGIPEAWWKEGLCREGTGRTGQLLLRDEPPPRARGFANSRRSRRAASRSGLDSAPQAARTSLPSPRAHLRSPAGQQGGCAPGQTGLVRLETPKTGGEIDLAFGGRACGVTPGSRGVRRRGCGRRHSLPLRV